VINAALRSITGVPDVVGANEWKAWNIRRRT
jgi:hypothetical protein